MVLLVNRYTATGVLAVVLWSAMTGLIRLTSEAFGAVLGSALIYTCAAVLLWIVHRPQGLHQASKRYLVVGSLLFVAYEMCASLSVGLAASPTQAIEVSIVNYLWPSLTVLLVALHKGQARIPLLIAGLAAALVGTSLAVGGSAGLDVMSIGASISSNPLPYVLALLGALAWAVYSAYTPSMSNGCDCIALFFSFVAIVLWGVFFASSDHIVSHAAAEPAAWAPLLGAAIVIAAGYACWNVGILKGNIVTLSCVSYAAPVLSSAVASALLSTSLAISFWVGVALVTTGSVLSWLSMQKHATHAREEEVAGAPEKHAE